MDSEVVGKVSVPAVAPTIAGESASGNAANATWPCANGRRAWWRAARIVQYKPPRRAWVLSDAECWGERGPGDNEVILAVAVPDFRGLVSGLIVEL